MTTMQSSFASYLRSAFILLLVCASLSGCRAGDDYHLLFVLGLNAAAANSNADLAGLAVSDGLLDSSFDPGTLSYSTMFVGQTSVTVTPTAADSRAIIRVNGTVVVSGQASQAIALNPGPNVITVSVTAADGTIKTYAITANQLAQLAQQAYAKASNTGVDDSFGYSVALAGDTLAVGALDEDSRATGVNGDQDDNSAADSGAVYVFTRNNAGVWIQQAYLKASNTEAGDKFGSSLALSGDTLAVGAPNEDSSAPGVNGNQADNSASGSGAVYVFSRSGAGVWTQQAYVKASNTQASDNFGYSVALDGDTLAVGAVSEDSNAMGVNGNQANEGASTSGAAYVFSRSAGIWAQQAYIKASNTGISDRFGASLALDGDTLAVGANLERSSATGVNGNQLDDSAYGSGAVYVFSRSGAAWAQQAYVKASNAAANDNFGSSLALDGDTLAVGAHQEDSSAKGVNGSQADGANDSGAAYVFIRSGVTWAQQAYVKASNTDASDMFGRSVALDGDTLAVGAVNEDSNATGVNGNQASSSAANSGAAYVFSRSGQVWTQRVYLKASNPEVNDLFGSSLALSGGTLAVGAYVEDSNATGLNNNQTDNSAADSGAVYLFR